MSSSNPGQGEDEEQEENARGIFSFPSPPQTPSTNFFMDSPSFLPEDLLGYTDDFSLLFPDDHYIQSNPFPTSLENTSNIDAVAHEEYPAGIAQAGGLIPVQFGEDQQIRTEDIRVQEVGPSTNSPSSSMMMMEMKKKKMDHNAKERVRRLHLNASYLTLRSLLPDSHKPKEKWSAPYIIDRTLDHIPQLEVEMEKLKLKKKDMVYEVEKARHLRQAHENLQQNTLSVAINEIKKGQIIIQVCHHQSKLDIFPKLLFGLESEGIEVLDASVFDPCEYRSCYHIRIQMDESSVGDEYVAELKERVISWLS